MVQGDKFFLKMYRTALLVTYNLLNKYINAQQVNTGTDTLREASSEHLHLHRQPVSLPQFAFLVPQKQERRLVSHNHSCRRKTPLISATEFCSELQCRFLFTENNADTTRLLDQPNTCHTLLSSRCCRPTSALAKSRKICKHSRSCGFFPLLSADQVCSLSWLLIHLLTHIRTLYLLSMLSSVCSLRSTQEVLIFIQNFSMLPSQTHFAIG